MKLIHFVRSISKYYGSYYYIKKLTEGLKKFNIETTVFCYERNSHTTDDNLFVNTAVYNETKLPEQLLKVKPDVIHFHDIYTCYLIENNKYMLGQTKPPLIYELSKSCKRVRTLHDYSTLVCPHYYYYNDQEIRCKKTVNLACVEKNCISKHTYLSYQQYIEELKEFNAHFYFSENMKSVLEEKGMGRENCFKIPPLIQKPEQFAHPEDNLIIFAGRLSQEKGIHYLIKALSRIKDKNWKLVVAGMDNLAYYRQILHLCEKMGLKEKVYFAGFLEHNELEKLYLKTKIMIFPSTSRETYGFSGAEAVSYGIPVIAFDIDGISEWMIDGNTGITVPVGNDIALAGAIDLLLTNDTVYKRYRDNCCSWSKKLNFDDQIEIMGNYYHSIKNNL